jgi:hypothetical protein
MARALCTAFLFAQLACAATAFAADGPHQLPAREFRLEECETRYSAEDYRAMARVVEVAEVRQLYPGSYMFVPEVAGPHSGVLWLHGSEGGRYSDASMCRARFLATRGYAALFFCYSDCGSDDLPEALYRVDLKRTYEAMKWLKQSQYVNGNKVALSGWSRGAEQTLVLAQYLGRAAATDSNIVVPDAIFAHAPYGRIVGAFNWRWRLNPPVTEWRWNATLSANLSCLNFDPNGPYAFRDGGGNAIKLAWKADDAACSDKPALMPDECWREDANGPYQDNGRRYAWLAGLCGVAPPVDFGNPFVIPAWTWEGNAAALPLRSDIALQDYLGAVLITHGTADNTWDVRDGAEYLMNTLQSHAVSYRRVDIEPMDSTPDQLPTISDNRITFGIFHHEGHGFLLPAQAAEWSLKLSFLERYLR